MEKEKLEYKIVSINSGYEHKSTGNFIEKSTINHIFIAVENSEYNEDTDYENNDIDENDEPKITTATLCNIYKNGLILTEDGYFTNHCSFKELDGHFKFNKRKRVCKTCTKKLENLNKKYDVIQVSK